MKVWIAVLKVFGYVWVTLGVIAILIGIAGIWMKGKAASPPCKSS